MENTLLQNIKVTQNALTSLTVTAIVLFLLPVIYTIIWKKRCGKAASFIPLLIGAAGFLVFARVLELGVHMVCIVLDNPISRFINGSTAAYVLYGIFMAGIFEECGRYIIIRFLMKRKRNAQNIVMYGIGHGGMEVWSITLLSVLSLLFIAVTVQTKGVESALPLLGITGNIPENLLYSVTATLMTAANFGIITGMLYVFERICCMFIHIAFTILVAYGIVKDYKHYLPIAILAHAAVDTLPALFQRGVVNMWIMEAWLCICTILLVVWSRKLYREISRAQLGMN